VAGPTATRGRGAPGTATAKWGKKWGDATARQERVIAAGYNQHVSLRLRGRTALLVVLVAGGCGSRAKTAPADGAQERRPGEFTSKEMAGLRTLFGGDFPIDPTDRRKPPGFSDLRAAYVRCVPRASHVNLGGARRLLREARHTNRVEVFDLGACRSLAELEPGDREGLAAALAKERISDSWGDSADSWPGIVLVISTGASGVFVTEVTGENHLSVDNPNPSKQRRLSAIGGTADQIFLSNELVARLTSVFGRVAGPQFTDDNTYGLDRWRYETAKLGRKDGIPFDATTLPLPSTPATFWTSEERAVVVRLLSPAVRKSQQSIFLVVRVSLPLTCEYAGPVFETPGDPAKPIEYRARIWHRHGGDCDPVDRIVERVIAVHTYEPRTFRFLLAGSATATVEVKGPPRNAPRDDRDRPAGAPCRSNTDCSPPDFCVPDRRDASGPGTCGQICNQNLDCHGGRCDRDRGIVGICVSETVPCDDRHPCAWGQICRARRSGLATCEWPTRLRADVQRDCLSDGACSAGLKCLKETAAADAPGRCRMLCTSKEMACEGKHACQKGGVCQWLGE